MLMCVSCGIDARARALRAQVEQTARERQRLRAAAAAAVAVVQRRATSRVEALHSGTRTRTARRYYVLVHSPGGSVGVRDTNL